jgi:alpha-N-acetylglucosaminidase
MGGKIPWNGVLSTYSTASVEVLNYENKGNLIGFGFAPEGIENNEIIYELLADMGWSNEEIKLDDWIGKYCEDRYGAFTQEMKTAYDYFLQSCFGTFTDHPRFKYQFGPRRPSMSGVSVHKSEEFTKGVIAFLNCRDTLAGSELYKYDAIEVSTQYLGLKVDELLYDFEDSGKKNRALLDEAIDLLNSIDRLLASHPNLNLKNWVDLARSFGDTPAEKDYYESNARQIITIWGDEGQITDYAARVWSGLIKDYYIPRLKLFYEDWSKQRRSDLLSWEKQWVKIPWKSSTEPFENPVEKAYELVQEYRIKGDK